MPPRTRIKICGITRVADALRAVELGADTLGFIFYPRSPRYITPAAARAIIDILPPFVSTVAVVVSEPVEQVREILAVSGCQLAQLHGSESPEYLAQLGYPAIKVVSVSAEDDLAQLAQYPQARAILLDTKVSGQFGGTGMTFDWRIARKAQACGRPIILAGGLHPENVAEALRIAEPYAIDVSSGIERAPGEKDHARMEQFFAAVRAFTG